MQSVNPLFIFFVLHYRNFFIRNFHIFIYFSPLSFSLCRVLAGEKLWEEKARQYHLSHRPVETNGGSNEEAASSTVPVAWPRVILLGARDT